MWDSGASFFYVQNKSSPSNIVQRRLVLDSLYSSFHSPWQGVKVDYGIWLSYRLARLHRGDMTAIQPVDFISQSGTLNLDTSNIVDEQVQILRGTLLCQRCKIGLQIFLYRSIISLSTKTSFHASNWRSLLSEFELWSWIVLFAEYIYYFAESWRCK
jgi:hypothetical protein